MIISQQLIEKVQSMLAHESLIIRIDETLPRLLGKSAKDVVVLCVQLNIVSIQVLEQVVSPEHFRNLDQLIRIRIAVKEGLFPEDHRGEHGAQ
jgi:hypothetical protein